MNPEITDGLKVGSTIKIPNGNTAEKPAEKVDTINFYYHVVEPKETVYSICKMVGITEEEFLTLNPQVRESGLQIGQTIRLPKNGAVENMPTDQPKSAEHDLYKVLAGNDLAKIAAKFNTTTEELLRLNPELASGLVVGRYILVPQKRPKSTGAAFFACNLRRFFLVHAKKWRKPEAAFCRGFAPVHGQQRFYRPCKQWPRRQNFRKSDCTAIQFLSGFLTAMDTLKGLGYQIELDIYDSQNDPETNPQHCP